MYCFGNISGINRDCEASMGGIKEVYLMSKGAFNSLTFQPTINEEGVIEKIDLKESMSQYYFRQQTGSASTELHNDVINGVKYYEHSINLQFSNLGTEKNTDLDSLADADVVAIVKDNNNRFWLYGWDRPLHLTENTSGTGTSASDLNGYEVTLTGISSRLPIEVDPKFQSQLTRTGGNDE